MEDSKRKLIRITTIPASMRNLLRGQLKYMSQYYEVVAISSDGNGEMKAMLHEQGDVRGIVVEMKRHPSPWNDFKSLCKLVKVFHKEKPFIVHTHTPKAGLLGMVAARITGVPHRLHTVAGLPLLVHQGMGRKVLNIMEKVTSACATQVLPNSYAMMRIMEEEGLCKSEKMCVIGNGSSNGVDTKHFSPDALAESKSELRQKVGFEDDDFVFVFIGRIVKDKGMNELAHAISLLSDKELRFKVVLIGGFETSLDPVTFDTTKVLKEHPHVKYLGGKRDVRPFLKMADALVFPSYREGFPNVVMEAGAMGLPAIVTDINGCNEIVVEGKNGRIIPPKDSDALANMMQWFIEHPVEVEAMGSNARQMVVERYEREFVWEELLKTYQALTPNN